MLLDWSAEARRRGEGALHDPASRQQREASLGLRESDDLPFDAVYAGGLRLLAGIALVDISQIDAVPGGGLHGLSHMPDLDTVVGIGGCDTQGQEIA